MAWQGLEGHDQIAERFRRAFLRGRLGGTYLFLGPAGIGKRSFALKLAQVLLCERVDPQSFSACQYCRSCLQVTAGSHPDLMLVSKPPDKAFIPLELLIGDRGQRGLQNVGLVGHLSLTSYSGRYRIAIIDDADHFNLEGANALLKTLEEPPAKAILILIGTSPARQLPTIRSRSQIIRFQPLSAELVASLLLQQGVVTDPTQARQLAQLAGGNLGRAEELMKTGLAELFLRWKAALAGRNFDVLTWSQELRGFVESVSKDSAVRRQLLQQIIALTVEFFRHALRNGHVTVNNQSENSLFAAEVQEMLARSPALSSERLMQCIEASLSLHELVERNVIPSLLIDDWLLQLWRLLNS